MKTLSNIQGLLESKSVFSSPRDLVRISSVQARTFLVTVQYPLLKLNCPPSLCEQAPLSCTSQCL
jgi:hypothetical protein